MKLPHNLIVYRFLCIWSIWRSVEYNIKILCSRGSTDLVWSEVILIRSVHDWEESQWWPMLLSLEYIHLGISKREANLFLPFVHSVGDRWGWRKYDVVQWEHSFILFISLWHVSQVDKWTNFAQIRTSSQIWGRNEGDEHILEEGGRPHWIAFFFQEPQMDKWGGFGLCPWRYPYIISLLKESFSWCALKSLSNPATSECTFLSFVESVASEKLSCCYIFILFVVVILLVVTSCTLFVEWCFDLAWHLL